MYENTFCGFEWNQGMCVLYMFKILPPGQNAFKRERIADASCSN